MATLRILSIQPALSQSLFAILKANQGLFCYIFIFNQTHLMRSSKFRLLARISIVNPFGVSS